MKKIINYYLILKIIIFIFLNFTLYNIEIKGKVYEILIIILLVLNIYLIIKFRKNLKYKTVTIICYIILMPFCKNIYYLIFDIINIILIGIISVFDKKGTKIFAIVILSIIIFYSPYILFILMFLYYTTEDDIYADTHYYCNNNYEIYSYSGGGFDGFHYSIGKHYEFVNINDIIEINYSERNEVSQKEYDEFLQNNDCRLVGEENGTTNNS